MSINNRYKVMQGLFWMLFCVSSGFISLYLQGRGVGTGGIGTVTAVFGILAALLQPLLGGLVDRSSRLTWRSMILIVSATFFVTCIIMPLIPGAWSGALFIGLLMLFANVMLPFINSAHFYYVQAGETINFGVARGIGSGLYALAALAIGMLAERFGIEAVPLSGVLISGFFILVVLQMPSVKEAETPEPKAKSRQKGFLLRYPSFSIMLVACLMMLTTHSILNTFLLQIIQSVGGNSSQLGIALAIQAIVEVPVLFSFSKLLKHNRPARLMLISLAGYALKATLFALSGSVFMIYAAELTQMVSFAIFASASVFYASESVAKEDQTTGQAYMSSMFAIGTVLGGLLGGWLLELSGTSALLMVNVVISLLGVGLGIVALKYKQPMR